MKEGQARPFFPSALCLPSRRSIARAIACRMKLAMRWYCVQGKVEVVAMRVTEAASVYPAKLSLTVFEEAKAKAAPRQCIFDLQAEE